MLKKIKHFFFTNTGDKQTVIKNTVWLFAGEASSRLLKFGLIVYAARLLGASGWGVFAYALSVGSLIGIFSDIGIGGLITRETSQKNENYNSYISTALFIKVFLLLVSVILMFFISPSISKIPEAHILFPAIAALFLFDSLRELLFSFNRAFEKMEWETIVKTITNGAILVLGILLLIMRPEPVSIAIAYALGSAIGFISMLIIMRPHLKKMLGKVDRKLIMPIIVTVWPFALIALTGTIMTNTDIYMLGIWKDPNEIGWYAAAGRLYQFVLIIPAMIATAVFPLVSRLAQKDNEKFSFILEKGISLVMMAGIPIAFGGIILAPEIILLIFGDTYIQAVPIMRILFINLLVSFPYILLSNAIFTFNKQRSLIIAFGAGVIANIVLNFFLIEKFGAAGSAAATLASSTAVTILIWQKMKSINHFEVFPKLTKVFCATICMCLLVLVLKYTGVHFIINIFISSAAYIAALYLLKEPLYSDIRSSLKL